METQKPLEELRKIRLEKLNKIRVLGVNPYPSACLKRTDISDALKNKEGDFALSGRVISIRSHGKIAFLDLVDFSGKIQLAFKSDELSQKDWEFLELLDLGDFIWVKGGLFITKAGELTLLVKDYTLLSKSLRPLPSEHFGLKDEEERFRQRYVDLALTSSLREMFVKKSIFWKSFRDFLTSKGFLEVETPVLEATAGGADAEAFVTHHNALDANLYLRISMGELWQKRLMVGGFEKTFEIGRQFRNEGVSREHLQDYTQMEFYWAYANYRDSMALVEEMYKFVAQKTFGRLDFEIDGKKIDLGRKWEVIDYTTTLQEKLGINVLTASQEELLSKVISLNIPHNPNTPKSRLIDLLWKKVRKEIVGPVFLTGHPVEVSPLAKRDEKDNKKVERYQIIIAGSEMGNGYSELNDPVDQKERFLEQQKMREGGDSEAQMYDSDFIRALEYGMPPVTGFGVSERLFAFLMDKSVRECVLFPLLRPEINIA